MTAEELKDIALCGETTTIQFKQEFTGQKEIAKEMIAFANTRGGKIIFGIKDKTGELLGLSYDDIQSISRELGNTANEQATRENVKVEFVNNEDANEFKTIVWRTVSDSDTLSANEKEGKSSETGSETEAKSSETGSERVAKGSKRSSERILNIIKGTPSVTIADLAKTIGISSRAVEKQIRTLRETGRLTRVGGDFGGHWQVN